MNPPHTNMEQSTEQQPNASGGQLTYAEALISPCASCDTSPCCAYLPLNSFEINTITDLDHAVYVTNFHRIELGLTATGEWKVYYCRPCRYLDLEEFVCTIYESPGRPEICDHYNPYSCWYKPQLPKGVSDRFLRVDRRRLEFILSQVTFDAYRNIAQVPSWETMVDAFADLPIENDLATSSAPEADAVFDQWQELAIRGTTEEPEVGRRFSYGSDHNPCDDCESFCCNTLVFPQSIPISRANLDFYRFCLSFPGVELGIADAQWSLVVKTSCRHLEGTRCSVYETPQMPILCRYYDEWQCSYRLQFALPRSAGFLRVKLEQFDWLTEPFELDENGAIVKMPPVEALRTHIEDRWRSNRA